MENQTQPIIEPQASIQPTQANTSPSSIEPKKSFPKWILIIVGLVLIIGFGVGAYVLGQKSASKIQNIAQTEVKPTPTPDPTANWETESGKYLTFKYPNTWKIKINNNLNSESVSLTSSNNTIITYGSVTGGNMHGGACGNVASVKINKIYPLPFATGLFLVDVTLKGFKNKNDTNEDNELVIMKNSPALGIITDCEYKPIIDMPNPSNQANLLTTNLSSIDKNEVIQILSTLKFTDQTTLNSTDEFANWKTYSSSYDSFSLKYPSTLNILEDENNGKKFRTFIQNSNFQIVVYPSGLTGQSSLEAYRANLTSLGASGFRKIQIDKNEGFEYQILQKGENSIGVIFIYKGKLYEISASPSNSKDIKYLNQILTTFKFSQ